MPIPNAHRTKRQTTALTEAAPWAGGFGACPTSWNLDDEDYATEDSDGSGLPGVLVVVHALETWICLNDRPATVELASMVFNLSPAMIRQAVDEGGWLYLDSDGAINLDGA